MFNISMKKYNEKEKVGAAHAFIIRENI